MNRLRVINKFFCKKNQVQKEKYIYDTKAFDKVNNKEFVKRMEKLDKMEKGQKSKAKNLIFPGALIFGSIGIYALW